MKIKLFAAAIAAVVGISCVSCSDNNSSFEPSADDKKVVMTVGGKDVEYQEFRYYLLNNKRDSFGEDAVLTDEQKDELRALTEQNAKYTKSIDILAERYDVTLSSADLNEIEAYIADFKATQCQNNDNTYRMALEAQYMTDYIFRMLQQNIALAYATIDKMEQTNVIKTDDATIDALLAGDDLLCIKEVFIGYNTEESKSIALARAEQALDKLTDGEDFAEIMRKYSDYNTFEMSPDNGYYTTEYEMPEYIWNAAVSLAEGEHSAIIESAYGYHLVMRCEKDAAYMEQNREDIKDRYVSAMYSKMLEETMDSLEIVYTDFGSSLDVTAVS